MSERPIIYLDNAATTFPKPEAVYQAMDSFYRQFGGNAGRGANPLARKAAALVEETRILVTDWLDASEVVFSPSATIALNTVILGAGLRPGDVLYLTPFEHNSVLRPVEHLRKSKGIEVRRIPFERQTFECNLEQLTELFYIEPPTILCLTQVSNVFGLVLPVDQIIAIARGVNPGVIVLVDGAQAAGLLPLDMPQIDALVFSGHKSLYGPYGVAGIAFNRNWRPQPIIYGGTGTQSESLEMPLQGSSRFEAGSQNICALAGLNAAVKWLNEKGRASLQAYIRQMTRELQKALSQAEKISTFIPTNRDKQFGIVSFSTLVASPQAVETALGAHGIAVRSGLHCAPRAHEWCKTSEHGGAVRVSVGFSNTIEEIKGLSEFVYMVTKEDL